MPRPRTEEVDAQRVTPRVRRKGPTLEELRAQEADPQRQTPRIRSLTPPPEPPASETPPVRVERRDAPPPPQPAQGGAIGPAQPLRIEQPAIVRTSAERVTAATLTAPPPVSGNFRQQFNSLNGQILRLYQQGRYLQAFGPATQLRDICRQHLKDDVLSFAASLSNLAALHKARGNFAAAEPLFRQALEITRATLGDANPALAQNLNNLASLHVAVRSFAAAELLYREASAILKTALGDKHPDYAQSLNHLAALYQAKGDLEAAESIHRQVLEIRQAALDEPQPDQAQSLDNLAALHVATGQPAKALKLLQQSVAIDDRLVPQVYSLPASGLRSGYLQEVRASVEGFLSLVFQYLAGSADAIRVACDLALRRKGIAFGAPATQRDAVLCERHPDWHDKVLQLTRLRRQIVQKTLTGAAPGEAQPEHRQMLDQWNTERERIERLLAEQLPEVERECRVRAADGQAVAAALPPESILVEFVRFRLFDFKAMPSRGEKRWKPARYVAFVIPAGDPAGIRAVELGEAAPIDQLVEELRVGLALDPTLHASNGTPASSPGTALRQAVFDPLVPLLGGRTRLVLAPDGDLVRVPFEALPAESNAFLIDTYQISYVACGRDVLRTSQASLPEAPVRRKPARPLVAADPDYDLARESPAFAADYDFDVARDIPVLVQALAVRGPAAEQRPADLTQRLPASRLPGASDEGRAVATLLGVEPWLDGAVLDAKLKAVRSPPILHLATQAFFLPDAAEGASNRGLDRPLVRAGLLLAGFNVWRSGGQPPTDAEDGALNGEDVLGMDLLGTELVVLSACDALSGPVRTTEGLLALMHAFAQAGARTLVLSMWRAPDEVVRELLTDFYQRLLSGEPRAEALRQARLAVKARHPHPYYWGAFRCQGDAAPLPPLAALQTVAPSSFRADGPG